VRKNGQVGRGFPIAKLRNVEMGREIRNTKIERGAKSRQERRRSTLVGPASRRPRAESKRFARDREEARGKAYRIRAKRRVNYPIKGTVLAVALHSNTM